MDVAVITLFVGSYYQLADRTGIARRTGTDTTCLAACGGKEAFTDLTGYVWKFCCRFLKCMNEKEGILRKRWTFYESLYL